ncbi:uncharacterized protein LOC100208394 isoform X1 [Hydra vulgaris]|uniref:uncharacterized protein LOC100208394 isoform X1 n=1 Tax=Hydra vulgaris TaxID=6087 RepID=UPI0032EA7275
MAVFQSNEKIQIKFIDLHVSVNEKEILKDVSGEINPGEVIAIMGPSGAGKSTLLNLLANRKTKGVVLNSGSILINGEKNSKFYRRKIGYVMQEDIFFSHLTVRQTLEFVGKIRLPDSMKWDEKLAVVDKVIENLGLRKCENTVMGGNYFTRGCSGGEAKRCSIAVELITNPACIILDEPTTGLDSSTAFNLMNTLKNLALKENRAICLTIHQPSSQVFHMFDKLLLLCNGRVMFFGKNSHVLPFFESIGMPVHSHWNPADFFIEKLKKTEIHEKVAEGFKAFQKNIVEEEQCSNAISESKTKSPDDISFSYDNIAYEEHKAVVNNDSRTSYEITSEKNEKNENGSIFKVHTNKWPTSYRTQVTALWKRTFIQTKGDVFNAVNITQAFLVSIVSGLIWFQTPYDESSLRDREGAIFYIMGFLFIELIFDTVFTFPSEDKVIEKERAAGMYRLSAFYTVKNIVDLSVLIIPQSLIYTISYWMIGLNRSSVFLLGLVNVFLLTAVSQSVGLIIGGSIKSLKTSNIVTILFCYTNMMLGGFYTKRMPTWFSWGRYLSVYAYFYNIFVRMEFEYAKENFQCTKISTYRECFYNNRSYITGPELLTYTSPMALDVPQTIIFLVSLILILRTIFYFVLKYCNKIK